MSRASKKKMCILSPSSYPGGFCAARHPTTSNPSISKSINISDFCRRYLRETLKMANAEDLNRLTSCSLVLLGHIFLSINNSRESMNMVTPAMQLASKIPDVHVQLWASAILKGTGSFQIVIGLEISSNCLFIIVIVY